MDCASKTRGHPRIANSNYAADSVEAVLRLVDPRDNFKPRTVYHMIQYKSKAADTYAPLLLREVPIGQTPSGTY